MGTLTRLPASSTDNGVIRTKLVEELKNFIRFPSVSAQPYHAADYNVSKSFPRLAIRLFTPNGSLPPVARRC